MDGHLLTSKFRNRNCELQEEKKAKKRKAADGAGGAGVDAEAGGETWDQDKHAWRPFDRERDLGHAPTAATPAQVLKKAGSLSSRFGGGGGGPGSRSFL